MVFSLLSKSSAALGEDHSKSKSLLANALSILRLGRDWRRGLKEGDHKDLLSLFADTPESPFSIHKFVEHGAKACGKHPGEWFGPSATARSIQ